MTFKTPFLQPFGYVLGVLILSLATSAGACNTDVKAFVGGRVYHDNGSDQQAGSLHYINFRQAAQDEMGTRSSSDIEEEFVSRFDSLRNRESIITAFNSLRESAACGHQPAIDLLARVDGDDIETILTQAQVQAAIDDHLYDYMWREVGFMFGREIRSVAMSQVGGRTQFGTVSYRYKLRERPDCTIGAAGDTATCNVVLSVDVRDEINNSFGGIQGDISRAMRQLGNDGMVFDGAIQLTENNRKWTVRGDIIGFR